MARVRVYPFKAWDVAKDDYVVSRHLATREAIEASSTLVLINEGSLEVDSSLLDGNGWTRLPMADGDN